MDRTWKPNVELAPNCPRCHSSNTKFCYYNNYSLNQPRYFCKGCRRYWTKGGSLRNVPLGGGCRKNRRGNSLRLSSTHNLSPDLAHDGMEVMNSCQPEDSSASDGSAIDLAVLYAKFLTQCPKFEQGLALPELPRETGEPVNSNQTTNQSVSMYDGYMKCQRTSEPIAEGLLSHTGQQSVGELEFTVDPSWYRPLAFPTEGAEDFSPICPIVQDRTLQTPKYQGFGSVLEDSMSSHHSIMVGDWNTFDQSSLEALYMP